MIIRYYDLLPDFGYCALEAYLFSMVSYPGLLTPAKTNRKAKMPRSFCKTFYENDQGLAIPKKGKICSEPTDGPGRLTGEGSILIAMRIQSDDSSGFISIRPNRVVKYFPGVLMEKLINSRRNNMVVKHYLNVRITPFKFKSAIHAEKGYL